ncbi:putative PAS/PAC sensor protein [Planktothrix serta PCC 8927]|uniref:PAS/PAC sensor protein n=1 Tax=Planktothrix serta PCC 8927 TaxID=671068 RepID=A0A7Z9BYD1_9CYAN|nr:HEAT repeat domain-containing protein [Planktothrix serta]VXD25054.1 putative PAS/PAC sensor protein [Planktothrix serta PCC 8927]
MSIGIFTTDINLIIRSWDSRLLELTGISADMSSGQRITDLIPDLEQRGLLQRFQRVITEGVIETLAPAFHQYLIPCPPLISSKYFQYMQQRVTITPLRDKNRIVGSIVTLEDVTVRREREIDIEQHYRRDVMPSETGSSPTLNNEQYQNLLFSLSDDLGKGISSNTTDFMNALQESSWQVRREVVERLTASYNPEITTELLQLLRQEHRNATIVNSVIQVLALSRVDLIPALIECLHDSDPELRIYAAQTLGQREDLRAVPALVLALADPDQNVRYHAIEALGRLKARDAIDPLLEIAQSQDFFLAFPALDALMQIGDLTVAGRLMPLIQKTLNWRVRREAVDSLAMQDDPSLTQDLLRLLREQHRNPDILNSVLQVLVLSHIDPIPSLVGCLSDPDPELRIYTALALGERHDPRAIPALIPLLDDPDINVRYHTIESLGHLRATEAVDKLVEIAQSGDFFLAFPALEALMKIGDATISSQIVYLLKNELLGDKVAEVLGELGDADVVTAIASCLNQPDTSLFPCPVSSLAIALAKIYHRYHQEFGEGEFVADLTRRAVTDAGIQNLLNTIKTANPEELGAIVLILGWLEGESVAAALTELLSNPQLRETIIEALVRFGSSIAPLLIAQLDAPDLDTRKATITALGRIGSNQAVPALTDLLSADAELVMVTTAALAQIGDQRAFEALLELLGHPDSAVRLGAIAALNSLGHPNLPERILHLLTAPNPVIRESAVKIAGYFAFAECIEALFNCTHDPEEKVRRAAIEHLPYLEDQRVVPRLVQALREEVPPVRAAVAHALGDLEAGVALPHLLTALQDNDSWVRYQAARSIGRLDLPALLMSEGKILLQVFEVLENLVAQDVAYPVRAAATSALGHIGGDQAIPLLTSLVGLDIGDGDIARAAVMALGRIESTEAVAPLLIALNSTNPERRLDALHAFRERGGEEAGVALQWMAAADPEEKVVHAAIESLSRMGTPEAIAALLELSVDSTTREACIVALASRTFDHSTLKENYIEGISQGLNHLHPAVRCAVVEVLKRLKHPFASEILISALNDQDQNVRLSAVNALVYLGNRGCTEKLGILARNDPSAAVRRAAQKGLHQ